MALAGAIITMLPINLLAQDADAEDEELEELEAFTMVGSRINRVDAEPINPVVSLDADSIRKSGYTSIADAIRSLPMNNGQSLTPSDSGTSFTPGVETMNLRGLGNNNSLVLLNGRRIAPYAIPGFNGLQSMFDISSIPDAAIATVDIETDGASAIYGSDAVAGVANYVLRTDYEGATATVTVGNFIDTDGFYRKGSGIYGFSTAKSSVVVAFSYERREAVHARDLDYTANADNSGDDYSNDHYEFDDPDAVAAEGLTIADWEDFWGGNPTEAGEWNQTSAAGFPGMVYIPEGVDGWVDTYYTVNNENGSTDPASDWDYGYYRYNFSETAGGIYPEIERYSLYTHIKHDITDTVHAFAEISYAKSDSLVESAPTPAFIQNEQGLTPGSSMIIPTYNPYNIWGVDIGTAYRRMVENGTRSTNAVSEAPRILLGLNGELKGDWTWEVGALRSENKVKNHNKVVTDYGLQQALMGLTEDDDGSLYYDESTAYDDRVYYNWFGENSDEMVDFLTEYNDTSGEYVMESIDFNVGGTVFELPAGNVGVSVGAEYRTEALDVHKSYLNEKAMIVGGSEGTSFGGDRDVTSIFAETVIPAAKWLEFQLAARYEQYSDEGYGSAIRPKIGFKLKPFEWLAIRGSYGESFKAPDLAYMNMSSSTSFSSDDYVDPVTGVENQLKIITKGNPDLKPELTDSYFLGIMIAPTEGIFENVSLSVDYIRYEQTDLLMQLSEVYGYDEFLYGAATGNSMFVDKVVRDNDGNISYILDDYMNVGDAVYEAFDLGASYFYETEKYGTFSVNLKATRLLSYEITANGDTSEEAGTRLLPKWRGNLGLGWSKGDWSANVFVNYIQGRDHVYGYAYDLDYYGFTSDSDAFAICYYDIGDQFIVNPSISYSGLWDSTITIGVNNVFNDAPPSDPKSSFGYTTGVNHGDPFFWYVSFTKEF